jgi:hypothetical protein
MLPESLKALLVLQERDQRRTQFEKILAQMPRERAAIDARILQLKASIEAAKKSVTELELKRKEIEATIRGIEEQVARYKNQQILVKKNDEYQALTHEIELAEAKTGVAEEEEIRLLYELDEARDRAKDVEREANAAIAAENAQLDRLAEREKLILADLDGARAEVDAARGGVPADLLPRYDGLVRNAGLPVVVPLRENKCGGCHLKVSAGVASEARVGNEIVACDNCSRILIFEF